MPEKTTGLRSLLSSPRVYDIAMFVLGSKRSRRLFVDRYLRLNGTESVLDIGCGTADILEYIPDSVQYTGYDTSAEYVASCRQRYPQHTFVQAALPEGEGAYDVVLALGVLHHMSDGQCRAFFAAAKRNVKPGGRVITLDACKTPRQNPAARLMFAMDRGQAIRYERDYLALAKSEFSDVESHVVSDLMPVWIPYTHIIMEAKASVRVDKTNDVAVAISPT